MEFDRLGSYSILKDEAGAPVVLGRGVWGPVHKAFHNDLHCYAAVRLIPRDAFQSEDLREQFVSDARMALHIRYPSLASVFPLELIEESYLYAIEFCDGETLTERMIRDSCLGTLTALNIGSQIAAGLDVACSAGLVHRNVRAENIMLAQDDEEISAKILDLALPAISVPESNLISRHACDFASPEESAGKPIDVRSNVYSLGALLYYIQAGAEKYALFRTKSLANEEISFDEGVDFPAEYALIFKNTLCHDPGERFPTFAELRGAIEKILSSLKRFKFGVTPRFVKSELTDGAVVFQTRLPELEQKAHVGVGEMAPSGRIEKPTPPEAGGLTIPAMFLGAAQVGTVLRLKGDGEMGERLVACVRDNFRIGRSAAGADLAMQILPRSKSNDTKTKQLSRIHVTAKRENGQILLVDGDGVSPSANGSMLNAQVLSTATPLVLLQPGELRLADICSIRVIPRTLDHDDTPAIANIGDWTGPTRESSPSVAGAIVFVPNHQNETGIGIWLFSVAPFGSRRASPIDFAFSTGEREVGALRYYRGCFWIEQRSSDSLSVDGFVLAPSEIAPLVTGQALEVNGRKYSVKIDKFNDVV